MTFFMVWWTPVTLPHRNVGCCPGTGWIGWCPNHTKLSVWFQLSNCWGLCWENRCWPVAFHTLTVWDADGWCHKWLVWSAQHEVGKWLVVVHHNISCCPGTGWTGWCPNDTKLFVCFQLGNCWGLCWEIDVGPLLFTLLQPEMLKDDAISGQCDQPNMSLGNDRLQFIKTPGRITPSL